MRGGTLAGIAYGMGAGAVWGLVFLAPELAHAFGPLPIAVGRYLAFGAIAAGLLAPRARAHLAGLPRAAWPALAWLAMAGNTLYYVLLATAVQRAGVAMTSLIIGFLPVAVTIIGSRDRGAVPLARLAPSLLACAAGAACLGRQAWADPHVQPLGLACAGGALVSWTAFAVGNSRWLARLEGVTGDDWNLLIGVMTGLQAVLLVPAALLLDGGHGAAAWARLAGVSVATALLASIVGNAWWNRMARLLPLTLVGQMILFETLFALLYGLMWERRLPTPWEGAAFALVVFSVASCVAAHRPRAGRR